MRLWLTISLALLALLAAPRAVAQTWSPGFGRRWIRTQPFTLAGLNIRTASYDDAQYRAAGFSAILAWEDIPAQVALAGGSGMSWHAHLRPAGGGLTDAIRGTAAAAAGQPGGLGWLIHDEPSHADMAGIGEVASWLRTQYPGSLVYSNAFPSYASAAQLYGDDSHPGYTWEAYLTDYLDLIDPDVLLYDHYPFRPDGQTNANFFSDLVTARRLALERDIPYWTFIQSWGDGAGTRMPSESDLRAQLFAHLAAGYTGLFYFTYDAFGDGGLLDASGAPRPLYAAAAAVNPELSRLGHVLRYLHSTDLRYVPGQLLDGVDNPLPAGLRAWSPRAGGDARLTSVAVDTDAPGSYGLRKNGLLGFFEDDDGARYFMLVNMSHGAGDDAVSRSLTFYLDFGAGVASLTEMDRVVGVARHVPLHDGRLEVTLLGGSGRLYAYGASAFPPDVLAATVDPADPGTPRPSGGPDAGAPDAGDLDASVDAAIGRDSGAATSPGGDGGCSCRVARHDGPELPGVLLWLAPLALLRRGCRRVRLGPGA